MLKQIITVFVLISIIFPSIAFAQRRPTLRQARRDYFAGRLLLIPGDAGPSSTQQPRMIAEIADHDLITPPVRILDDPDRLFSWASSVDFDDVDGVILWLDAFSSGSESPATGDSDRLFTLIKLIRSTRAGLPIYGYLASNDSSGINPNRNVQRMIDAVGNGSLDFLLVVGEGVRAEFAGKLGEKIGFVEGRESATMLLLARMICNRFGYIPRVLPVYSSNAGRDAVFPGASSPLHNLISDKIVQSGGIEVEQSSTGARNVDLILFIHAPKTRDQDRPALADIISQTIEKNVRIGFVDLSETRESRDAMMAELRRRKLLDRLATYSAMNRFNSAANNQAGNAVIRSLAQSSAFLVSIRFLRDDLERLRRVDRSQVGMLLSRYLSDWAIQSLAASKLRALDTVEPRGGSNAVDVESLESLTLNELKPVADELFNDQFRHNVHAFLLSYGERAQFEVRMLQRISLRISKLPGLPGNQRGIDVGLRPSIYLVYLGNALVPQLRTQKLWQLAPDGLDERLAQRWASIDWLGFKTDAESVEMIVKISPQQPAPSAPIESYAITSKRTKNSRRIEISAQSNQGAFYAINKLEQMGADGQLAQDFQVSERASTAQRGILDRNSQWSYRDRLELIRFTGRVRMNRYYYVPTREPARPEIERVKELLRVADENFIQFVYGIRPDHAGSYDEDFANITRKIDELYSLGVRRFLICFDAGPAAEQANFAARIRDYLKRGDDTELSVLPTQSSFKELSTSLPYDIKVLIASTDQDCLNPGFNEVSADSIVSPSGPSQVTKFILAQFADLAWYGSNSNPQKAFDRALSLLLDERSRTGVRAWAQTFADCRDGGGIDQKAVELQSALELIIGTRERGLLRGELAQILRNQKGGNAKHAK